jgi:hypothetical protein
MRRKPALTGTLHKAPGRNGPKRLRDTAIPAVPTVRTEPELAPPATSEQESEAEAAVRRMVEAAYT